MLNPGEAFAETYRVLNEQKSGATVEAWNIVSTLLYPDATALALLEQDVTQPWAPSAATRLSVTLTKSLKTKSFVISTPYDGTLSLAPSQSGSARERCRHRLERSVACHADARVAHRDPDLDHHLRPADLHRAREAERDRHEEDEDDLHADGRQALDGLAQRADLRAREGARTVGVADERVAANLRVRLEPRHERVAAARGVLTTCDPAACRTRRCARSRTSTGRRSRCRSPARRGRRCARPCPSTSP